MQIKYKSKQQLERHSLFKSSKSFKPHMLVLIASSMLKDNKSLDEITKEH